MLVTQLVNKVMLHGKRSLAEKIVYDAMKIVETKTGEEPSSTRQAGDRQRQAAARGQEPPRRWRHLPGTRRGACRRRATTLAIRWIVDFSRARREKTMAECLAAELLDAANGLGAAMKKRDDMQKMAESNKAFAHYRW